VHSSKHELTSLLRLPVIVSILVGIFNKKNKISLRIPPDCLIGTLGLTIHTINVLSQVVHPIDTLGFDDDRRSDVDVLREIVFW
jgi:hypothetical protein